MAMIDPALYWLVIGVMLFFLEMAVPGFILFFFGMGAVVTALAAWMTPISVAWQLALFICTSLVLVLGLRKFLQNKFFTPVEKEGRADLDVVRVIPGDKGVVSMTIVPPAEGRIKYSGTSWRASADEQIEAGEIVAVVYQKDLVVHVEKI